MDEYKISDEKRPFQNLKGERAKSLIEFLIEFNLDKTNSTYHNETDS